MLLRTAGFSVAYSLATALFGGFTPAVSTYLIQVSGNRAVAGLWLMFAATCGTHCGAVGVEAAVRRARCGGRAAFAATHALSPASCLWSGKTHP